ncbi:MAG: hypothetical protein RL732_986 [Bacteroidota bacterium]
MKPKLFTVAKYALTAIFPLLLLTRLRFRYLMITGGLLVLLSGCFVQYFSNGSTNQANSEQLEKLKNEQKFFIIHFTDAVRAFNNIAVKDNRITGTADPLPKQHTKAVYVDEEEGGKLKGSDKADILNEVHIYVNKPASQMDKYPALSLAMEDIYRMDVYEFDKKKTGDNTTISVIGIAAVVAMIIAGAVAANKPEEPTPEMPAGTCGCPYVYKAEQGAYEFQNGVFSGAVYSNLERIDYLPISQSGNNTTFDGLRISGHQGEVQYLNQAQLLAVQHPQDSKVLTDPFGKLHSLVNLNSPSEARSGDGQNISPLVAAPDGQQYDFSRSTNENEAASVILSFNNPGQEQQAKLFIRAKNSGWSSIVNHEYTLLLGKAYRSFRSLQERSSTEKMEKELLDQDLPIKVYTENNGQWEYVGYFPLAGTENFREMVLPVLITNKEEKIVKVKLETAFRFWDLDYAAIDFSKDPDLTPVTINAVSIKHSVTGEVNATLENIDNHYVQISDKEYVDLAFELPAAKVPTTYILKTSGYYHFEDPYPVKANTSRLKQFKQAGAFNRFSREKFREVEELNAKLR